MKPMKNVYVPNTQGRKPKLLKVQEASGETEVSETGISENETSGEQNGNNYQ